MNTAELIPVISPLDDQILRLAVAAHLARYKGQTRVHTASDLSSYFNWCYDRDLSPLKAQRTHIELYLRWMQEIRRFKPSTVSRRLSVLSGFYRTCVIDDVLQHSPAEYIRRPQVSPESPTLGLSHLQFEAMRPRPATSLAYGHTDGPPLRHPPTASPVALGRRDNRADAPAHLCSVTLL